MPPKKRKTRSSDDTAAAIVDTKRPRRSNRSVAEQPTPTEARASRASRTRTTAEPKAKPTTRPLANKKTTVTRSAPKRAATSNAKPAAKSSPVVKSKTPVKTAAADKPTRAAKSTVVEKPKRVAKAKMGRPVGRPKKTATAAKSGTGRPVGRPRKTTTPTTRVQKPVTVSKGRRTKAIVPPVRKNSKLAVEIEKEPVIEEEEEIADEEGHCFWLMKAEPESRIEKGVDVKFSIDDLKASTEPQPWDGVRNYVARNNMRAMQKGDQAFFYHSNCKVPGIVGIMEIVRENSVDETALDPKHPYFDPKATPENPKWSVVHVEFRRNFPEMITLAELRTYAQPGGILEKMELLKQGRLSVSKVTKRQWDFILKLANQVEGENPPAVSADVEMQAEQESQQEQENQELNLEEFEQDLANQAEDVLKEVVQEAADEAQDHIMMDVGQEATNEAERAVLTGVAQEAANEAQKNVFEEIVQEVADAVHKEAEEGTDQGLQDQAQLSAGTYSGNSVHIEETSITTNGDRDSPRDMNGTNVKSVLFGVNGVHS